MKPRPLTDRPEAFWARPYQTKDGGPRDGKRTDRAKQITRTRRQERRLKLTNPHPRLEA